MKPMRNRRILQIFLTAIALVLTSRTVESSHVDGGYVYSWLGWTQIATGGSITYGVNPTLPAQNGGGADTWAGIRQATNAWNVTRYRNSLPAPVYATEEAWGGTNNIQYRDLLGGLGWIASGIVNGSCITNPPYPSIACYGMINGGDDSWMEYNKFLGGHVHELGHALGGLADHLDYDCSTVMSTCAWDLLAPTQSDLVSMKTVYGIPHNLRIIRLNELGSVRATAENRSTYYQLFRFDLWKWINDTTQFLTSNYVYGSFALGDPVYVEDDLYTFSGPGWYTYKITVYQEFPNGVAEQQQGDFADWIQIDPPPYQLFLPVVMK